MADDLARQVRVAIYARISRDRTGEALGVQRQVQDSEVLAKTMGWRIVERYVDNDVSASKYARKNRPEYSRLLVDGDAGRFDAVICYSLDRLTRKLADFAAFHEWLQRNRLKFATCDGDRNTDANAEMVLGIKAVVAQQEAARISERVSRSRQQRREMGLPAGGRRLFGYEPGGIEIRESEAKYVPEIFEWAASGAGLSEICSRLTAAGVKTSRGSRWTTTTVRSMILNARYAGQLTHVGKIIGEGNFPAIVSRELWERASDEITLRSESWGWYGNTRKHIASGFCYCGLCGAKMAYRSYADGRARVECPPKSRGGCGRIGRDGSLVEEALDSAVTRWGMIHGGPPPVDGDVLEAARQAAEALNQRIIRLRSRYSSGELADEDFFPLLKDLRDKLREAQEEEAELESASRQSKYPPMVETWELGTVHEKAEMLKREGCNIFVLPVGRIGRRPPLTSVRVRWLDAIWDRGLDLDRYPTAVISDEQREAAQLENPTADSYEVWTEKYREAREKFNNAKRR